MKDKENATDTQQQEKDLEYMDIAIEEASFAEAEDEVPIGAVIVRDGKIIARAHNTREGSKCATHHAEILAIEKACEVLGGWRLPDTTLYVTLEPCAMCAGAIINARIPRVVYGAPDIRFGAFGSLLDLSEYPLNHKPEIVRFIKKEETKNILGEYFRKKRQK
jgi:tRNA(adenine34) deaminase